jgi:hypothetical protein
VKRDSAVLWQLRDTIIMAVVYLVPTWVRLAVRSLVGPDSGAYHFWIEGGGRIILLILQGVGVLGFLVTILLIWVIIPAFTGEEEEATQCRLSPPPP